MPAHCPSCGAAVHTSHFWIVTVVAAVGSVFCLLLALGTGHIWLFPVSATLLIAWMLYFRKKQRLLVTSAGETLGARRVLLGFVAVCLILGLVAKYVGA